MEVDTDDQASEEPHQALYVGMKRGHKFTEFSIPYSIALSYVMNGDLALYLDELTPYLILGRANVTEVVRIQQAISLRMHPKQQTGPVVLWRCIRYNSTPVYSAATNV